MQRPREQLGEVAGLLVALDRREDEFDRPLRGEALRLERIGEAEAAHDEIRVRCAAAIELTVDVLAFAELDARRQQLQLCGEVPLVQVGRADLDQLHPQFAREEASERNLELRVGEEEHALPGELEAVSRDGLPGPLDAGGCHLVEALRRNIPGTRGRLQPRRGAIRAQRERCAEPARAAPLECLGRFGEEWLREQETRLAADGGHVPCAARRQERDVLDAERLERAPPLVLDHVRKGADDQQLRRAAGRLDGQSGHQRREARILALREGRLDSAARVAQHADPRRESRRQSCGRPRQVQLDDFGRTRPDQEQQLDVGAPLQQAGHDAVEFVVRVGDARPGPDPR